MPSRLVGALAVAMSLATMAPCACAGTAELVTGTFKAIAADPPFAGHVVLGGTFTCFGYPTCTGSFSGIAQDTDCANTFALDTGFTITGLDLSHPGKLTGQFTFANNYSSNLNGGSTCTYALKPDPFSVPLDGTWNGSTGSFDYPLVDSDGTFHIVGSFDAAVSASPVFPMTVDGQITPATTDIDAQIQPRAQDVGSNASVFVFAHAPSNLVIGAHAAKRAAASPAPANPSDDSIVCVLAQVNASGQLVAVSASTMQAYVTGVLSSQQQAVQVLNNVPTPNVAGATMYVGYGASAQAMLSSGVFQTAISVPGGVQCTASLSSAPAPKTPGPLTGLWWNPNEPGWGMHIAQRSNVIVVTWYTYDASGNPKWYIASNCPGPSGASGSCTAPVYEVNGPRFFGVNFVPLASNPDAQVSQAGALTLTFADANNADVTFTVAGVTRTVAITRQIFDVPHTASPAVDYTDLWWNPNESGWGMAISHQYGDIFLAWYVYDANGKPMWYVASNCVVSGSSCSGTLYRTTSAPFGPTYDANLFKVFTAGSAIVSFVDANNAVLSYTVDNVTATKTIARQIFP